MVVSTFGGEGDAVSRRAELATLGHIIDISISGHSLDIPAVPARGLIDTGASVVVIDRRLALQAGLKAVNTQIVQVPGGINLESTVYAGYLEVPSLFYKKQISLHAVAHKQASHDVLLGRAFLKDFIVTFNGPEGMFHFWNPSKYPGVGPEDDYAS